MRYPAIFGHLRRRHAGFTMIELLVVIAVIALLMGLITAVGARVIEQQKIRGTRQTMQTVTLAIEQFATENPLGMIYDKRHSATFGKYPPYQLANQTVDGSVAMVLEPDHPISPDQNDPPDTLAQRLAWDLSGQSSPAIDQWVHLPTTGSEPDKTDGNDDIRGLYAYLKVFSPAALNTISEAALKPIDASARDYVNPKGLGTAIGNDGLVDVLGIYDAWGVPLDYMLYVKCEWRLPPGESSAKWVVTERKPVLRSRGVDREMYDAWVESDDTPTQRKWRFSPPDKWMFSEDLPKPWASLTNGPQYRDGLLNSSMNPPSLADGWVRAVGLGEDYAYRPDGDAEQP